MSWPRRWLLMQLGSTLPLVGLIWLVQLVAYPLFAYVGPAEFASYHAAHSRLITFVVAPLMLVELVGALASLFAPDRVLPRPALQLGVALAVAVWLSTFFAAVPQHDVLARGFDPQAHALLLAVNWVRTGIWTARGALLLWAVARISAST